MGLKPSAPKAPDPTKTANAQLDFSKNAAQSTINMNSLDRSGPFGSSTFTRDANGNITGQNVTLSDALKSGADATQKAYSENAGSLPTAPINWDTTSANTIAQNTIDAYQRSVAPQREQAQTRLSTMLSDRGIPIGSEVYNDAQGNLDQANAIGDANAISAAWNAVPQNQSIMTNTQIAQNNQPYQTAGLNLGLLQGINSLNPYAPQGSASIEAPNYTGLVNNQYNAEMQKYQSDMNGINNLVSGGLGLLTAPLTGGVSAAGAVLPGLSDSLLGRGVSNLFNNSTRS